jgi:hypothetical protein
VALSADGFDRAVPLPPGLTIAHISAAIEFVEEKAEELIELYFEQANIFSGVVGILGVRALDSLSPYKRHKHPDIAQQRLPGLVAPRPFGPLHPSNLWNPRAVPGPGPSNRTTTTRGGTSSGAMQLTPPNV